MPSVGHDAGHNGGEGRRGTRDLHATATEERDEEAGDDGGVEALFRRDARGDAQRDGKRQRHHGHHDARHDVLRDLLFQLFFAGMLDNAEKDGLQLVALLHGGKTRPPSIVAGGKTRGRILSLTKTPINAEPAFGRKSPFGA